MTDIRTKCEKCNTELEFCDVVPIGLYSQTKYKTLCDSCFKKLKGGQYERR